MSDYALLWPLECTVVWFVLVELSASVSLGENYTAELDSTDTVVHCIGKTNVMQKPYF